MKPVSQTFRIGPYLFTVDNDERGRPGRVLFRKPDGDPTVSLTAEVVEMAAAVLYRLRSHDQHTSDIREVCAEHGYYQRGKDWRCPTCVAALPAPADATPTPEAA